MPESVYGRPVKQFDESVARQWHHELNAPVVLENVGRGTKKKRIFQRRCGCHFAWMSPEGAHKRDNALSCSLCQEGEELGKKQPASEHAKSAAAILGRTLEKSIIITEAHVLKDFAGAMDFTIWLPFGRIMDVEVDGEHHFVRGHHNNLVEEQNEVDAKKDKLALEQGRRLVRLHYLDKPWWPEMLKTATIIAMQCPKITWVLYTKSYGKTNMFRYH